MFAEARYNFPICWTNRIRSRDRNPPGDVSPRVATEGARVSVHFRDHTADLLSRMPYAPSANLMLSKCAASFQSGTVIHILEAGSACLNVRRARLEFQSDKSPMLGRSLGKMGFGLR